MKDESSTAPQFDVFLSHSSTDKAWVIKLKDDLLRYGVSVWLDQDEIRPGDLFGEALEQALDNCRAIALIVSPAAIASGWVKEEYYRALHLAITHGTPVQIIPVMLQATQLPGFLQNRNWIDFRDEKSYAQAVWTLVWGITGKKPPALKAGLESLEAPLLEALKNKEGWLAEDGQIVSDENILSPPLEIFDPRLLEALDEPSGAIRLRDKFYIERQDDNLLKSQLIKRRSMTTIRASRQTGKSSLLARGLHYARQYHEIKVIRLDLQEFEETELESLDVFLRAIAAYLADEMELDEAQLTKAWRRSLASKRKLTRFMKNHILPALDQALVLAIDETDRLLQTKFHADFFGLLRSWYNNGAEEELWERLSVVLVISTEPHLFIDDLNQSPFNVGLRLNLKDFDASQVQDLNQRYGQPLQIQEVAACLALFNGHPYLTRKAFYTMVTQQLSWPALTAMAIDDDGPFADHLSYQYRLMLKRPDLAAVLKQVIQGNHAPDEKLLYPLVRAGLAKGSGDTHTLRCDLYRRYFQRKLGS